MTMKTFEWQIGEMRGEVQRETMRAAMVAAFLDYIESSAPAITEHLASLRIWVKDKNFQPPQTAMAEDERKSKEFNAYIRALWQRGYRRSTNTHHVRKVDFVLTDHATSSRIAWLADYAGAGCGNIFVYPHTARPNLVNDITPEYQGVTAHFVSAGGHVDVMRAYGYEKPLHVVGWSLCPIEPFRAREQPRNVLFAPIHERCAEIDKRENQKAFRRLVKLVEKGLIHLTVRYYKAEVGTGLAGSGLERYEHPEIEYYQIEQLEPDWEQIDQADLVVSHQTYAWMAVARGVPTVMFGRDIPPHLVPKEKEPVFAKHWDDYRKLMEYPYDINSAPEAKIWSLFERAVNDDKEIADWKQRMIGEPFDDEAYVNALEGYL
jgi:hypothetical protein